MNVAEKELVVLCEESYNLCPGGEGGFDYINVNKLMLTKKHELAYQKNWKLAQINHQKLWLNDKNFRNKIIQKISINSKGKQRFLNKHHTEETKKLIGIKNSVHQSGTKNSQYGTCWVTDGQVNKKVKREEVDSLIPLGYRRGRV